MIFENQTHEYHYTIPNSASSNNVTDTLNPLSLEREQKISKQISGLQLDPKFNSDPKISNYKLFYPIIQCTIKVTYP